MSKRSSRVRAFLGAVRVNGATLLTHPSNRGRRGRMALRLIRFEFNALRHRPTIVPLGDTSRVSVMKGADSSDRTAFARLPDWPEMDVWRGWLRPGDLFVDVGANVGLYTLVGVEQGAEVIAIEPTAESVLSLRTNLALNDAQDRVRVVECAAMNRVGRVRLAGHDRSQHRATFDVAGSTAASTIDLIVGAAQVRGMKIDVEGNERLVLDGASELLARDGVELIQLEWNWTCTTALGEDRSPVASILREHGFTLFQADDIGSFTLFPSPAVPRYGRDVFAARAEAVDFLAARMPDTRTRR